MYIISYMKESLVSIASCTKSNQSGQVKEKDIPKTVKVHFLFFLAI